MINRRFRLYPARLVIALSLLGVAAHAPNSEAKSDALRAASTQVRKSDYRSYSHACDVPSSSSYPDGPQLMQGETDQSSACDAPSLANVPAHTRLYQRGDDLALARERSRKSRFFGHLSIRDALSRNTSSAQCRSAFLQAETESPSFSGDGELSHRCIPSSTRHLENYNLLHKEPSFALFALQSSDSELILFPYLYYVKEAVKVSGNTGWIGK